MLSDIGRAFGKYAAFVFGGVAAKGKFALAPQLRKQEFISLLKRDAISRGFIAGRAPA